jgi:hypothetical protein
VLGLGLWLHGGERSLRFAKPWIESTINTADAPFTIAVGDVVVDWRNVAELGRIKISGVSFSRRNGNVFAQLPELYATIDPIGFLPNRRLLNKVILRGPRMFISRNIDGVMKLGIEGAPERLPMEDLIAFLEIKSKLVSHDLIGHEKENHDQLFSIKINDSENCEFILPVDLPAGDHVGNAHDLVDLDSAFEAYPEYDTNK